MKKQTRKIYFILCSLIFMISFISLANAETAKIGINNLQFTCTVANQVPSNSATYNISVYYPNGTYLINNIQTEPQGQGSFNYSINFPEIGVYKLKSFCYDNLGNYSNEDFIEVTPTGKIVTDVGQISVGLIYMFLIIGFSLVFLGYLFLKNNSVWVSYSGLFLMSIGFAFVYYDLHLGNLYASTIAVNSGAENVTTGAFVMVAKFLKLAPLIIAGIIAFSSVKVLKESIKKKKSSDGWDDNNYQK